MNNKIKKSSVLTNWQKIKIIKIKNKSKVKKILCPLKLNVKNRVIWISLNDSFQIRN